MNIFYSSNRMNENTHERLLLFKTSLMMVANFTDNTLNLYNQPTPTQTQYIICEQQHNAVLLFAQDWSRPCLWSAANASFIHACLVEDPEEIRPIRHGPAQCVTRLDWTPELGSRRCVYRWPAQDGLGIQAIKAAINHYQSGISPRDPCTDRRWQREAVNLSRA